jgi:hypothetical protein
MLKHDGLRSTSCDELLRHALGVDRFVVAGLLEADAE